jgi:hypothetical protein
MDRASGRPLVVLSVSKWRLTENEMCEGVGPRARSTPAMVVVSTSGQSSWLR